MVSIDVLDRNDPEFIICLNFLGKKFFSFDDFLPFLFFLIIFLEQDHKFPQPLRRCLLGFREGMTLFRFMLSQLTTVIRQKGYVYTFDGKDSGTSFEVSVLFWSYN